MELIHRVHLDPSSMDSEVREQFSGDSRRISEQGIKVRGCVKREAFPAKDTAISSDHVMLLYQQRAQSSARQQVGADQSANACTNNDHVIFRLRFILEWSEQSSQFSYSG